MVAQNQGGPQGALLGGVIDLFSGKKNYDIPPPTTQPLPWAPAQDVEDKKQDSGKKKEKNVLQKGAETVLKKLFK